MRRSGDFFGFFGAQKKGRLFWVGGKKSRTRGRAARDGVEECVAAGSSKCFAPRRLRSGAVECGAKRQGAGRRIGAKRGRLFWAPPQKTPFWQPPRSRMKAEG